jgi:hypothetical protein
MLDIKGHESGRPQTASCPEQEQRAITQPGMVIRAGGGHAEQFDRRR